MTPPKQNKDKTTTADPLKDRKDAEGNLIDPPTLPEFEQRLVAAHDTGDDILIGDITEEYNKAREEHALKALDRDRRRREAASA